MTVIARYIIVATGRSAANILSGRSSLRLRSRLVAALVMAVRDWTQIGRSNSNFFNENIKVKILYFVSHVARYLLISKSMP